ncbi:MAG: BREX-1 system adenine-specific DNA-methyltransferase PglX, partial [Firmicutes bacterium]|nr:BREX-1 system adenine-specific DNA-methyltransferase PglX [Bacillota bacterium]
MIPINDSKDILAFEYHRDNFLTLVENLLASFNKELHPIKFDSKVFDTVVELGQCKICKVTIYEIILKEGIQNRRVELTQNAFRMLREQGVNNALVSIVSSDRQTYRISLLTSHYEFDANNKIIKVCSNPRRYSYALGMGAKTKTAYRFLIEQGKVDNLDDLIKRFSIEIVNKEFYDKVSREFHSLVDTKLTIQRVEDKVKLSEFAVRLIGRIVFCWFLKEKKSKDSISLVPDYLLSLQAIEDNQNYYHSILELIFFESLNKDRYDKFRQGCYKDIPYLNGGLFSPHNDDYYKYNNGTQCGGLDKIQIDNGWFCDFYRVLNDYHFTVDENTNYDIELSIDPEMLGRIFENLLAEINPQTGESARKETGSFYTPREIVDYMVDSCILQYLSTNTGLNQSLLDSLLDYSVELNDNAWTSQDRKKVVNCLYNLTILDPACGSGAFPIGALQKITYILQKIDPKCDLWFDKMCENVPQYIKKEFQKKFEDGSFDYLRKLCIIEKTMYGIDLQTIAVEISRLRCFLSLIIEEKVDDSKPNRGVNPLPNLDFKFVACNSLLRLPDDNIQNSLFEDVGHIQCLKKIREEYFNIESNKRDKIIIKFQSLQNDMLHRTGNIMGSSKASNRYQALATWKPFENVSTDWFDSQLMFGVKEFDIVIANPPYVHLEKMKDTKWLQSIKKNFDEELNKSTKQGYKPNLLYSTYNARGDLYGLFYERGVQLLKQGGLLCYITSNKWLKAGYGQSLRDYFLNNTDPQVLIDLGAGRFGSATVDTNILTLTKQQNTNNLQ